MSENNSLKGEEIRRLLIEAGRIGANHALERSGAISPFIPRSEIVKLIGRSKYDVAVQNGELSIIKGEGVNGKIYQRFCTTKHTHPQAPKLIMQLLKCG